MEKSKLLWIIGLIEGWFYVAALALVFSLFRLAKKLNMPIMQPYKPLFRRLAVFASTLVFCGISIIIYLLTHKTFWQILVIAELAIASSITYFVLKIRPTWREIQHSSEINELRFIESKRFKAILDSTPNATISFNEKRQVVDWNKSAERIFQIKEEEMVGKDVSEIIPKEYHSKCKGRIKELLSSVNTIPIMGKRLKLEGLRKNGERFPMELFLSYYMQNNEIYFTALVRDLTEE